MAVQKQPESGAGQLSEAANDWIRLFLKHLEIFMAEAGLGLPDNASTDEYRVVAIRAVKLTLRDSGMEDAEIIRLFGRVALDDMTVPDHLAWNAERNKRRFELIDRDIQGTLSAAEQIELAGLTQLMREYVDSEANLPFEGARTLHRMLSRLESASTDREQ